jgi:hypothetical protein
MPRSARAGRILHYAVLVSTIAFLVGVIFLLVSNQANVRGSPPSLLSDIMRDLGVVLCSIGLISLLYEMLIRRQLINDYHSALQEILDPDTKKLGVSALFRDREDKTTRGRSLDALLRMARKEMLCLGLGFYQFLPEKRELLLAKVKEGCSFRFLIFNFKSKNATAFDESLGYANGSLIKFLEAQQAYFIDFIKTLADEGMADRFEVRTYDMVPTFGGLLIDGSMPDGSLIVELYGCRVEGAVCPGMELIPKGSNWYSFYERQMDELWRRGQPLLTDSAKGADAAGNYQK